MNTTATRIAKIIEEQLGCDPVTADNMADPDFLRTTTFDSLDMIELVMAIEEWFGVAITDDEAEQFRPGDIGKTRPLMQLVDLIEAKQSENLL